MENNWRQRKLLNLYYGKSKQLRSANRAPKTSGGGNKLERSKRVANNDKNQIGALNTDIM